MTDRQTPSQVGSGTSWDTVATGSDDHSCARRSDGSLWCWGSNENGQLGLADMVDRDIPIQVGGGTNWHAIAAHFGFTCATQTDGVLFCWGRNTSGQLGLGDTVGRDAAQRLPCP